MFRQVIELFCAKALKFNPWQLSRDVTEIKHILQKKYYQDTFLHTIFLDGLEFKFCDLFLSKTVGCVSEELKNNSYQLFAIKFVPGDCVIDIGGNIGMVSIYLAKKYPFLKIYAFEPVKANYENFRKNIELNKIPKDVITLVNSAVTQDGRDINLAWLPLLTGSSSAFNERGGGAREFVLTERARSTTLEDIFADYNIAKCKLLKIDCEGAEYEILDNAEKFLKKCAHLRGEFHQYKSSGLTVKRAKNLEKYCKQFIGDVRVEICKRP
jgi:FkbM family methyltransferase